jgi:hypothetical protein
MSPTLVREPFHTTGMEHSPTSATGTAWKRTPWRATQRAAWEGAEEALADIIDPTKIVRHAGRGVDREPADHDRGDGR